LRWLKACCCSFVHLNGFDPRSALKNARLRFIDLEMKRPTTTRQPVSLCASQVVAGGFISLMAQIFYGLALIPCWDTRYPSSFPECTLKVHFFFGFRRIPMRLRLPKVSRRSANKSSSFQLHVHHVVIHARLHISPNSVFENLLDELREGGSLIRSPKGIRVKQYVPKGVMKLVCGSSSSTIHT
jgi:hypothetical protein